ncbi:MAG: division/cell wall cluster transcriptional repressor MraZ [Acidimicrobiia bacterium]
MFFGRHIHTIDEKGRVVLPARFRKEFDGHDSCILAPGTDGQITLNLPDEFETVTRAVLAEAKTERQRRVARHILSSAVEQPFDKAGRLLVPEWLRAHAGISIPSEVAVTGAGLNAEIWNVELNQRDDALGASELIESTLAKEAKGS